MAGAAREPRKGVEVVALGVLVLPKAGVGGPMTAVESWGVQRGVVRSAGEGVEGAARRLGVVLRWRRPGWQLALRYSEKRCLLLMAGVEVVVSVPEPAVAVVRQREVAAGERGEGRRRRVKEPEARRTAQAGRVRQGEEAPLERRWRTASSSREAAAAVSCRLEGVGPFSASLVRWRCLEATVSRESAERQRQVVWGQIGVMFPSPRGMKSLGLLQEVRYVESKGQRLILLTPCVNAPSRLPELRHAAGEQTG